MTVSPHGRLPMPEDLHMDDELSWEELEAAEPMDFTINNVPARLEKNGDRWHDVLEAKQSLTKAFGVDS